VPTRGDCLSARATASPLRQRFAGSLPLSSLAAALSLALGCGKPEPKKPDRKAELEQLLKQGTRQEVAAAAKEYRELSGESPESLRTIASAYLRISDETAELEVMRALVSRGQGTNDDRRRVLELAADRAKTDDALYQTGITWLKEILEKEPWCDTYAQLVDWTKGRQEQAAALEQALAGCPRDTERARWFTMRAAQSGNPDPSEDVCSAVAHGATDLASRCAIEGKTAWKVAVAKAILDQEAIPNLRMALTSPDATPFVMVRFAQTPGVPREEACSTLARARNVEKRWLPYASHAAAIEGHYQARRQQLGCT
jgi:hypothetical protein